MMRNKFFSCSQLLFIAAFLPCKLAMAENKATDYCNLIATEVLQDPTLLATNVINVRNDPSCFFQASLSNPATNAAIAPARVALWNALESLSGSQQQGSSLSSGGSTNAVSKPSGPTSLIEEFGGANATTGTSSSTVQWSPGTMFTNLALTGAGYLCLSKDEPKGCISASFLKNLTPLTFKITANTSSGSSSLAGAATAPSSTSASQPVSVNSKGASGPGFAGLTVQYSIFGSKSKAGVNSMTSQVQSSSSPAKGGAAAPATSSSAVQYFGNELLSDWKTGDALLHCQEYLDWQATANSGLQSKIDEINKSSAAVGDQARTLQDNIEREYQALLAAMLKSQGCQTALNSFKSLYASILEAETYEDFAAVQQSSAKPEVALEYDLDTPQNQPSYSSAKITANWQFGKSTPKAPAAVTMAQPSPVLTSAQLTIQNYAENQAAVATSSPGGAGNKKKETAAIAKPVAQANAQPWSLTVTGTADIYNGEPPSSVPSASHLRDIQAGTEISYLFSPSANSSALRSFIGPITAAAAYSYQDQTSPAILTGPALSDFTGLPSSTTSAYAKRGVIHLGQLRLGFGTGSNTTFPLAFTYSNRTELITHPVWGVQFGVTYNMTSLFTSSGTTKAGGN
jgi:hypothetical protein